MNAPLPYLSRHGRTLAVAALLTLPSFAHAQTPVYKYDFNAGSGTVVNPTIGAAGTGTLTTVNNGGTATNLYSTNGAGVSGLAGDYAMNNSATVYSSGFYSGGFARSADATSANTLNLGTVSTLTLTMWINPTADIATTGFYTGPRLAMIGSPGLDAPSANGLVWQLRSDGAGNVGYDFGAGGSAGLTNRVTTATSSALSGTGWRFVAITFDVANDTFSLFVGSSNIATTLTSATDTGTYNATGSTIDFGSVASAYLLNRNTGARAFDGLADNFAIYSEVLTASQLDAIRVADLNNVSAVPEPSTYAAIFGGVALAGVVIGRRRRNS